MTDRHLSWKKIHLGLIEDLDDETVTLDSVEFSVRTNSNDTATLLTSVLKSMQTIISKACSILNTIDSKNTTFVMDLVIPI